MTRDHRRKKAARAQAAATGRRYLDAARLDPAEDTDPSSATRLREQLATQLVAAGWPVEREHNPQHNALRTYAGPAVIDVGRDGEPTTWEDTGEAHPDDPDAFDVTAPLRVCLWTPLITDYRAELGRVGGVDAHEIPPAGRTVADLVADIDQIVAAARRRERADTPNDARCGICGDPYPHAALFEPTHSQVAVCPCCAFDGDLFGPCPEQLAYDLDHAPNRTLAMPAGWAGVHALLCCLGGPDLPDTLTEAWHDAGLASLASHGWGDPGQTWVWLPPPDRRPAALAGLGCGAALAAIIAAIDRAHPGLRAAARTRDDDDFYDGDDRDDRDDEFDNDQVEGDNDRKDWRPPKATLNRIWPAAVAYTVALLTQQAERGHARRPWHVLYSFELAEWVAELDPDVAAGGLDPYHVESVLRSGIPTLREALDPREDTDAGAPERAPTAANSGDEHTDLPSEQELAAMLAGRPELCRLVAQLSMLPAADHDTLSTLVDRIIDTELTDP